jgi:hypothetical protein
VKSPVRHWVWRRGNAASHVDRRYGLYVGREWFGDMGEHYGYPRYRFGVYICLGHNTWFLGLSNEKRLQPAPEAGGPAAIKSKGPGGYSACGGCSPESTSDYAACDGCAQNPHKPNIKNHGRDSAQGGQNDQ